MTTQATIADQLAQLPNLPMKNLWAMWDEFFDQRPGHYHRTYLENRLAYKLRKPTCVPTLISFFESHPSVLL